MTQKELLYVEDAIEHEKSIIAYLEDMKNNLDDDDLVVFTDKELKEHQKQQKELCKLLEDEVDE